MKNKITSFIILLLFISVCLSPLHCAAAGNAHIVLEEKTAECGEEIELLLNMSNNPGMAVLSLTFSYDKDTFTLSDDGVASNGDIITSLDIGRNFFFSADANCNDNGVLAKLKFKVSPTAKPGVYPVTFVVNECINEDFAELVVTKVDGSITVKASDVDADTTETLPPYAPSEPTTTEKPTVTQPLPTTTKPTVTEQPLPTTTKPVAPSEPAAPTTKPVTEPVIIPGATVTTAVISTAKPAEVEPAVSDKPVVTTESQNQTQAPAPVTQPASGTVTTDNDGSPVLMIAVICVVAVVAAAVVIFLVKKNKK